jgi:predicted ArsR family transcriptional regulator
MLCKLYGMVERQRTPVANRRADVLSAVRSADEPVTIAQLAERLRSHPNTVRFHLERLVESGRIEQVPADHRRPGRPPLRFRAVPGMDPSGPRRYRQLAEMLLRELESGPDPEPRAERAGRSWGAALVEPFDDVPTDDDAIGLLVSVLADLGFAPDQLENKEPLQTGEQTTISLTHCPFLELVPIGPGLVCQIHLGLMRGVLAARSSTIMVDQLRPFAAPDRCLAHLAAA